MDWYILNRFDRNTSFYLSFLLWDVVCMYTKMQIFVSCDLVNLFMNSNRFLMDSLDFSMHEITSHVNRDGLTSSILLLLPLISFSCLTATA